MQLLTEQGAIPDFTVLIEKYQKELQGITALQRILVIEKNKINLAAILLACFRQKIVVVPLSPSSTDNLRSSIFKHSESSATFINGKLDIFNNQSPSPNNHRIIIYTSGTTGKSKGVMLSEGNIVSNANAVSKLHSFHNSVHATPLPLYHVNALCMSLFGAYLTNSTLLLIDKFDPKTIFKICTEHNVNTLNLVPTLVNRLIEEAPVWPKKLEYILSAAAPLSQRITSAFFNLYGNRLRQGYGLSEATNFSFTMPMLDEDEYRAQMVKSYPPVGIPIENTSFKIVKEEVYVKGPNVFMGYWKDPQLTSEVLKSGWLCTGDLGEWNDGYLTLKGRKKEIILKGGETIYPSDYEYIYLKDNIEDPIVFGVQDDDLGENIGLALDSYRNPLKLHETLKTIDKKYHPSCCLTCTIPRTVTGKIQRSKLTESIKLGYLPFLNKPSTNLGSRKDLDLTIIKKLELLTKTLLQLNSLTFIDKHIINLCKEPLDTIEYKLKKDSCNNKLQKFIIHFNCPTEWEESEIPSVTREDILKEITPYIQNKHWGWIKLRCGNFDLGGVIWIGDLTARFK